YPTRRRHTSLSRDWSSDVCSSDLGAGMHIFFMVSGALRSAGDARTPMILGIAMTVLNLVFNVIFIRGLGPIPGLGTAGAAVGTRSEERRVGKECFMRCTPGASTAD